MYQIERVLEALEDSVKEIIVENDSAEVKIFPGFIIESRLDKNRRSSNLLCGEEYQFLHLKGRFSDRYKNKIKQKKNELNKPND